MHNTRMYIYFNRKLYFNPPPRVTITHTSDNAYHFVECDDITISCPTAETADKLGGLFQEMIAITMGETDAGETANPTL